MLFTFLFLEQLPVLRNINLLFIKKILGNEVPVSAAGNYANPGTPYVLTNDITSATSSIFLGKNVILDLNGYTIKYADANYQHIANSGFEEGSKGWGFKKLPAPKC